MAVGRGGRHTSAGVEHVDAGAHAGARLAGRRPHAATAASVEVGVVALEGARVRDVVTGARVGVVDDAAAPGGRARGERGRRGKDGLYEEGGAGLEARCVRGREGLGRGGEGRARRIWGDGGQDGDDGWQGLVDDGWHLGRGGCERAGTRVAGPGAACGLGGVFGRGRGGGGPVLEVFHVCLWGVRRS